MADRKISQLPLRTELEDTDEFTTLSGGINYRSPIAALSGGGAMGDEAGAYYSSRAVAMATEIPPEVTQLVTLSYATPGDNGGAHYKRVASEPTHLGKFQSADGAWWELDEPVEVMLEMFGGKADGAYATSPAGPTGTDNWPALQAALGYGIHQGPGLFYQCSASIRLGRGKYLISQKTDISRNVRISGAGGAAVGKNQPSSILIFPENTTALVYWSHNTIDADMGGAPHGRLAYGSILENVQLRGRGGTGTYPSLADGIYTPENNPTRGDPTKHGIILYTTICMRQVATVDFAGDGIHVNTSEPGGGSANELDFIAVKCGGSGRHGMFIEGGDTNAGAGHRCDFANNGGYGLWDSSAYGNIWTGCHFDSNGNYAKVHHENNRYHCINYAWNTSKNPSTIEPGTDPEVWEYQGPGGQDYFYPTWRSGNKYFAGGSLAAVPASPGSSGAGGSVFAGCYMEGPQGSPRAVENTIILGGTNMSGVEGGLIVGGRGVKDGIDVRRSIIGTNRIGVSIALGESDLNPIMLRGETDTSTTGLALFRWNNTLNSYDVKYDIKETPVMALTTGATTPKAGRGAGIAGGNVMFPSAMFVGSSVANMRLISNNPSVPTVGPEYATGDISFNTAAGIGNNAGWLCTQGGVVSTVTSWAPGTSWALGALKTNAGKHYRVTLNPGGRSIIEPTHTAGEVIGVDGYKWKYLCTPATTPLWVSGTIYNIDDVVNNPAKNPQRCIGKTANWTSKNYVLEDEVVAPNGYRYRCTTDPGAGVSTVVPDHTTGTVTETDGYGWQSLGVFGSTIQPHQDFPRPVSTDIDGFTWEFQFGEYTTPFWKFGSVYTVSAGREYAHLIQTSAGHGYECEGISGTKLSTSAPTHDKTVVYPDGYGWAYEDSAIIVTAPGNISWVSGSNYAVGSRVRTVTAWRGGTFALNAEVTSTNGFLYRCTLTGGTTSTVAPSHVGQWEEVTETDGYRWMYLGDPTRPRWHGQNYVVDAEIVALNGFLYRCTLDPGGTIDSTVSPTHLAGEVTEADGYRWLYVGEPTGGGNYICTVDPGTVAAANAPLHTVGTVVTVDGYSWLHEIVAWATGTNYALGNRVAATNGLCYQCSTDAGGAVLSSIEPSHPSGAATGGDGYGWTVMTGGAAATDFWPAWVNGTNYAINANITAPNGLRYRLTEDAPVGILSTIPPTHDLGEVIGTDSYGWTRIESWAFGGHYVSQQIVVSSNNRPYKCSTTPPFQPSTFKPTHSDKLLYSDGYIWHHLGSTYAEWSAFGEVVSQQDINTNADLTLVPQTTPREVRHTGTLSQNRIVTLSEVLAYDGMRYRITRTGGNQNGVWTLNIGTGTPLATLRTGDWCDITFNADTSAWYLSAFGQIADVRSQQTISDGSAFTLTPNISPQETLYSGAMTIARAVTLSATGAFAGQTFRITRTATGAFSLNVGTGPLKALAVNEWCVVCFDGAAWYLASTGAL